MLTQQKENPFGIKGLNQVIYSIVDAIIRQFRLSHDFKDKGHDNEYRFSMAAKSVNTHLELMKELLLASLLGKNAYDDKIMHLLVDTICTHYVLEENASIFQTDEVSTFIAEKYNFDLLKQLDKLIEWNFITLQCLNEEKVSYTVNIDYLISYIAGEKTSQLIPFLHDIYNRKFAKKPSFIKNIAFIGDFFTDSKKIKTLVDGLTSIGYELNAEPLGSKHKFLVGFIQEKLKKPFDIFIIGSNRYDVHSEREFLLDNLRDIYNNYKNNKNICVVFENSLDILDDLYPKQSILVVA